MKLDELEWTKDGSGMFRRSHPLPGVMVAQAIIDGASAADAGPTYKAGQYCVVHDEGGYWPRLDPITAQAVLLAVLARYPGR